MGIRILHSLIGPIIKDPNISKQVAENLADQVIPGAEEILRLGTKICVDELQYSLSLYDFKTAQRAFERAKTYAPVLEFCVKQFMDRNNWAKSFGGEKWAYLARVLVFLENKLAQYKSDKTVGMEIVALLNIIDGLQHNSGAMMEKMLLEEFKEKSMSWTDNTFQNEKKIIRTLLDSKNLSEPSDIWWVVKSITGEIPYMIRRELSGKIQPPDRQRIQKELSTIRHNKENMQSYDLMLKPIVNQLEKLQNTKPYEDDDLDMAVEDLLEVWMDFPVLSGDIKLILKKHKVNENLARKSQNVYKVAYQAAKEIEQLVMSFVESAAA